MIICTLCALRYWQTRTPCCGQIVARDVSWAVQTGKHLLRTQNVSEKKSETYFVSRTQHLCPRQMFRARANGKHSCRQQCVRNNVSSHARALP